MKKFLSFMLLFLSVSSFASSLKISAPAKEEADLFMRFLQAVYVQRGNQKNAFESYQKALDLAPDSAYLKRQLVAVALSEDKLPLAEPYAHFITEESDSEDYTIYAAYLWKKGQIKEAVSAYEKALSLAPDDARILYQYVLLLTYSDADKAIEKLEEQTEEYPALAPAIYMEIGNIYLRRQNFPDAMTYYNKATKLAPAYEMPYLGRAEVYEKNAQFFLMLHELEELEKLNYASAAMYARMASVFLLSKDNARAEKYFLKAKQEDKTDIVSAYFLAMFAEQRGDFAQAVSYLQDSADYQTTPGKWLQVAFYLQRLKQPKASVDLLELAYKKFNQSVEIGYFYALALQDEKEYKKAAKVLEQVLFTNPSYDDARLAYANSLYFLNKRKQMKAELTILLEKNPENDTVLNLLAYSLAERGVELDEAQRLVARALAVNPQNEAAMDTQAWIYFKKGNLAEAENILAAISAELIQRTPEMAYHLGAVLFAQGKYDLARPYLELARVQIKAAAKLYKKLPKVKAVSAFKQ